MYLPLLGSLFLHTAWSYYLGSSHFTLQNSLEYFLQGKSRGNIFPPLLFIWKCLNFSLTFKRIFGWHFFLSELWMHCPSASGLPSFWWEVCWQSCLGRLVCDESLVSCCFYDSLSFLSLIIMCLCESLRGHFSWRSLSFSDVYIHVFHQVWDVFSHYFFNFSLCPFLLHRGLR